MSNRVPVDQVISRVINMLPNIDISQEIDKIYQWVFESELRIGSMEASLPHKECLVDIDNFRGKLPRDFYKVDGVKTGQFEFAKYTAKSFTYFNLQSPYLADANNLLWENLTLQTPYFYGSASYKINGNYIDISQNLPKVGLSYMALPLDADGLPLVNELHILALAAYIRYQIISGRYFSEKIARPIYLDAMAEWEKEKTRAQYIDAAVSYDEAKYIGEIISHHRHFPDLNFN